MWNKSCVVGVRNEPRSYVIRNEHGRMRRNRRDLYKTNLSPQSVERQINSHYRSSTPSSSPVTNSNHGGTVYQPVNVVPEVTPARTSRSGRPIRFPSKYRDYVCE